MKLSKKTRGIIEHELYEQLKEQFPDIIEDAEEIEYEICGYATVRIFWEDEKE